MIVTVEVTQDDIIHGKPQDCCECPVALAVQRTFGPEFAVDVAFRIFIEPSIGQRAEFVRPRSVIDFIRRFDAPAIFGSGVEPFTFTLDVPDAWAPLLAATPKDTP